MKAENLVADRRYGKILYDIAKKENHIEPIHDELIELREVFEEVPELGAILSDDRLEPFEKVDILHDLTKQFSDTINKFLNVIYEYGRMRELPQILDEFENLYFEDKGILLAYVTSAVELTEDEDEAIKEKIKSITQSEKVILKKNIDPEIIGGIIVNANHRMLDNSVASKLKEMHKELLA